MTTSTFLNPTAASFDREVLQADVPVLVEFWAPWCGPCRALKPIVEAVAKQRGLRTAFVNVDEHPELAGRFAIQSIPALMLFARGRRVAQLVGALPKAQLEGWLEQNGA